MCPASRSPCTSPERGVAGYFPFGPTIGASLNVTLLSYDGTCCIGLTFDDAAVPDSDVLVHCVAEGFEEVLALGGEHAPVTLPAARWLLSRSRPSPGPHLTSGSDIAYALGCAIGRGSGWWWLQRAARRWTRWARGRLSDRAVAGVAVL